MDLIFYLTRWPLPLGHNQDSSVSSVPCIFSHCALQCFHIWVGQGPHHPHLQSGTPASAPQLHSLSVWNSLLSTCPALCWRLRWSLTSSILLPGGTLTYSVLPPLSVLLHEAAATPNQGQGLSCLVLRSDSFLEVMLDRLSSRSYCFFLSVHANQPSTGLRTSLLIC